MTHIIGQATLDGAFESLKGLFNATLQQAATEQVDIAALYDVMTGTGKTVTVNWFGDIPAMRRWIGDRQIRNLRGKAYTITCVPWEDTVGVDTIDLATDQFGLIRPQIQRMARESVAFKLRRFAVALEASASALCADGQYLVDTDHPTDSGGTWSNKATAALTYDSLETALIAGQKLKDANGDPAGINYDTLMVPVDLRNVADRLINTVALPGSMNNDINPLRSAVRVIVNPYLTDTNNWYLFDSKVPVKPFVYVEAAGSSFTALQEDRSQVFSKGQVLYGIDGWAEISAYFPYGIYGSIVA